MLDEAKHVSAGRASVCFPLVYCPGVDYGTYRLQRLCVTDDAWLLKLGTLGPGNMVVNIGSDFAINCMTPDHWRAPDTHWLIYFTVTSIYCHLRFNSSTNCSKPHDMSRFSVDYVRYMMVLNVQSATIDDVGLYTCSRPAYFHDLKPAGHVAYVGIIRTFLHNLFPTTKSDSVGLLMIITSTSTECHYP